MSDWQPSEIAALIYSNCLIAASNLTDHREDAAETADWFFARALDKGDQRALDSLLLVTDEPAPRASAELYRLPIRAGNLLAREGIITLDQLRSTPDDALLRIPGFGPGFLKEVHELLGVPDQPRAARPRKEPLLCERWDQIPANQRREARSFPEHIGKPRCMAARRLADWAAGNVNLVPWGVGSDLFSRCGNVASPGSETCWQHQVPSS